MVVGVEVGVVVGGCGWLWVEVGVVVGGGAGGCVQVQKQPVHLNLACYVMYLLLCAYCGMYMLLCLALPPQHIHTQPGIHPNTNTPVHKHTVHTHTRTHTHTRSQTHGMQTHPYAKKHPCTKPHKHIPQLDCLWQAER